MEVMDVTRHKRQRKVEDKDPKTGSSKSDKRSRTEIYDSYLVQKGGKETLLASKKIVNGVQISGGEGKCNPV